MHEHPAGPTGTPRCALARPGARIPGRIVGRPGRVVAEAPCRIAAQSRRVAGAPAPYRSLGRALPCALCLAHHARAPTRLACRIVALAAVSWALAASQPGCIASAPAVSQRSARACLAPAPSARAPCAHLRAQPAQLPSHNTIFCIAAKF